jgi:23S rRNA pseudouridine2605 synthase
MRINRYLAQCGLGSRRSVEDLIHFGRVTVNGVKPELGYSVVEGDDVQVDGKSLKPAQVFTYILFNKPNGYLCSRGDTHDRPTVYDLLPPELQSLHYVGRLDMDSRGLLFFTNDGDLTLKLTHPSQGVLRTYAVRTTKPLSEEDVLDLLGGIEVEPGVVFRAAEVAPTSTGGYKLSLREGKKREIRRLLHALHHHVTDLKRIAFGGVKLGDIPEGKYRRLDEDEIATLKAEKPPAGWNEEG